MNNAINEIKITLEGTMSRITETVQNHSFGNFPKYSQLFINNKPQQITHTHTHTHTHTISICEELIECLTYNGM